MVMEVPAEVPPSALFERSVGPAWPSYGVLPDASFAVAVRTIDAPGS